MFWFANLSLFKKILCVSIIMLLSAMIWGSFNSYMAYRIMKQDLQDRNQFLVESKFSMIIGLQKQAEEGKISTEDAQKQAKESLRHVRYDDGKQYFWINATNGQAIMHPIFPDFETQDLSKTNPKVYDLFRNFAKALKNNPDGTEYTYLWSKPNEDKSVLFEKSSYIKQIKGWDWIIGTGIYVDELQNKAWTIFLYEMVFVGCFALILGLGTWASVRLLSQPLLQLASNMKQLSNGNLDVDVPHSTRGDEVGMIAQAFAIFKSSAIEKKKLETQQIELQKQAEIEKKKAMYELADSFEKRTAGVISALSTSSSELNKSALEMQKSSEENVVTSREVSQSIADANSNVQTVSQESEQLAHSSQEIAQQISSVAEKANRSTKEAAATNEEISKLNGLADSIGDVVAAIKGIAEQTNLLALNATIEAARAGEAGKGFAVVADEVKKLATETARKTTEIDERVIRIQEAIRSTVGAVERILSDIQDIDQATTTVAHAIEEQNAATSTIRANVAQASVGTQAVAHHISSLLEKSELTGHSATSVLSSSQELQKISNTLKIEVDTFLKTVRN